MKNIKFTKRADYALNTLSSIERNKALKKIGVLRENPKQISKDNHKLLAGFSGKTLFSLRSGPNIRIIYELLENDIVIVDIVTHSRLNSLFGEGV